MQVYLSVDIEGVAGVVNPQQGTPGNAEYERARRLMAEEANAAIAGAFDAGAEAVVVNDAHGPMFNLPADLMDPRAELILGKPKPMNMAAGLDGSFAAVLFVGYHAGARRAGVLAHTTNSFALARVTLNGREASEAVLYGAYAGSLGVPVVFLSGDDRLAADHREVFPGAGFVVTKTALGNRSARAVSPEQSRRLIRAGVAAALERRAAIAPLVIPAPLRLELTLASPVVGDLVAMIPAATRLDAVTCAFDCPDMAAVVGWVNVVSALSSAVR
ncbi:MAG: M55 family metallopeptidase [Thalassobaculales bacterium]